MLQALAGRETCVCGLLEGGFYPSLTAELKRQTGHHGQMKSPTIFYRPLAVTVGALLLAASFPALTVAREKPVRVVAAARVDRVDVSRSDRDFLEKAAKSGMEEVRISRVAAQRTTNPDVKRLAERIISDHENAGEALTALAASRGVALPAKDMNPNRWEKRDAKNFDLDYIDKMISDHENAVKLFEKQANNGDDNEAVALARKYLPKMQHHLQQAKDLKRVLK